MIEFDEWYEQLYPRLHAATRISCGSADWADDVVAETFERAAGRWHRVATMQNPDGWAYTVALNLVKRQGTRRSRERILVTAAAPLLSTAGAAPDQEATSRFAELVAGLPDRMRQVVVLRHVADLTEPDIAEVLGISRGTVSSTLRDAHQRIGDRLRSETDEVRP